MVDDGVAGKCITVIQSGEPNVSLIDPGNLVVSNFRFYLEDVMQVAMSS